jgi:hypothetical protein
MMTLAIKYDGVLLHVIISMQYQKNYIQEIITGCTAMMGEGTE